MIMLALLGGEGFLGFILVLMTDGLAYCIRRRRQPCTLNCSWHP